MKKEEIKNKSKVSKKNEVSKTNKTVKKVELTKEGKIVALVILVLAFVPLLLAIIVNTANYDLNLKFNGKEISFFNNEGLFFNEDVSINCESKGFKVRVDGEKVKKNFSLKEGNHVVTFKKYFTEYTLNINVDHEPSVYFVDEDGNVINNYLSNDKDFYIKTNDKEEIVTVNNKEYSGEKIDEENSYEIFSKSGVYNINILDLD